MKTLKEVIQEIQEFGERNNALSMPCYDIVSRYSGEKILVNVHPFSDTDIRSTVGEIDLSILDNYNGPVVVI